MEKSGVVVRQVNSMIKYGAEYMGATSRLVVTPLTDRCWLTITGALHIKLGASPQGPAGTGKTESTKDLAKALGIFCVVFNCSEQVEYKIMGRLFSGLIQSGAWSCLDEFNRIDVEVLSVIAQQLQDIRIAKLRFQDGPGSKQPHHQDSSEKQADGISKPQKNTFLFNDRDMQLKANCGVFITMNPGYAGRAELPDNLKVLFRPVAMMIPSYGLVAQVMLFAEGYTEAQKLSTKMVQLYKLSDEQLSQQDHYDFGMRAVKSVLVIAGNLKRANPQVPEEVLLIRAMRDANVPKFLADDLPLFHAIVQDLFPNVVIPEEDSTELGS
jgi:dynein heavy chain, axonemal